MSKTPLVYLAGPINAVDDAGAKDWRAVAASRLPRVYDPMCRDYRGRELAPGQARRIVEADKAAIDGCDILLANCWQPSVGTSMEVLWGWLAHKTVVVVVPDLTRISPWLLYHATRVFDSLEAALDYLAPAAEAA